MVAVPTPSGGYWFVSTLVDVEATLPATITPHVRLQRATSAQIQQIKSAYPDEPGFFGHAIEDGRENNWKLSKDGKRGIKRSLPRDKWRYFVLAYRGRREHAYQVKKLFLLADPPCTCRINVTTSREYGIGKRIAWGGEMYTHIESIRGGLAALPPVRTVTEKTLAQVRFAHAGLESISDDYPEIQRAIDMLNDLRMVPIRSDLYILGLFAILELLLTHNPNDKENADSLRHQLSTKIPLLDTRLPEAISYTRFTVPPATLWKKLYDFRSKIAHGESPKLAREFKVLGDANVVREFVQSVCQKLIRYAIDEPALFRDLKPV